MNPLQCDDITIFINKMDEIINSKEVEWQGRKITFGTEENLQNIDRFLSDNAIYWKDTSNPIVGTKLRELSTRIKKEDTPLAKELADQKRGIYCTTFT